MRKSDQFAVNEKILQSKSIWRVFIIASLFIVLVIPLTVSAQDYSETTVRGLTEGRIQSLLIGAAGLLSLIVGISATIRSKRRIGNHGQNGAYVAIALGCITIILGVIHLINAAGAPLGSGSGKAGTTIALLFGLVGVLLAGLTIARNRKKSR